MSAIADTKEWLRPSMLPKLALCAQYRPESNAGPAADRGTRIDKASRDLIAGRAIEECSFLPEDLKAIRWNVETARALAGEAALLSEEDDLRVEALGLNGTADLACEDASWSADFKTGQIRNYLEQQAIYSLGFMDRCFVDEWTVYLLFCDQEELQTLRFTREEAEQIVRGVLAKVRGEEPASANEYCGWCALRWTCKARREAVGILPLDGPESVKLEELGSVALRDFVLRAGIVEDFAEKARELLKDRTMKGEKTPGVSLCSKRGSRKVLWKFIEANWKRLGTAAIGAVVKMLPEKDVLEIVNDKMPGAAIPAEDIFEAPGSTYVRVGKPKEGK